MLLAPCIYTANIYSNSNFTLLPPCEHPQYCQQLPSKGPACTLSRRIKEWIKREWFMDVKDPSIPFRVPSQRPCCLFSLFFFLSQAYKPGQTLALPEFMRMFSFILIKSIHTSHSCEMISCWILMRHHMKGTAAQCLFVASRFALRQKCCHNWPILCTREQSDLLCKLTASSKRQMMLACLFFVSTCVWGCTCQHRHNWWCVFVPTCECVLCVWSHYSAVECERSWGCNAQWVRGELTWCLILKSDQTNLPRTKNTSTRAHSLQRCQPVCDLILYWWPPLIWIQHSQN